MQTVPYNPTELVPECPACGGEGALLGALGARFHFRCRCCGIDYSMLAKKKETK